MADSATFQALKDANLALVAENQKGMIAVWDAADLRNKSQELTLAITPIKNAIAEFAIINGGMPAANEVQVQAFSSPMISSSTWDGTNIVVVGNTDALGVTDSEVGFSVTPTITSSGGVSFECVVTAGAQYLPSCN